MKICTGYIFIGWRGITWQKFFFFDTPKKNPGSPLVSAILLGKFWPDVKKQYSVGSSNLPCLYEYCCSLVTFTTSVYPCFKNKNVYFHRNRNLRNYLIRCNWRGKTKIIGKTSALKIKEFSKKRPCCTNYKTH